MTVKNSQIFRQHVDLNAFQSPHIHYMESNADHSGIAHQNNLK